MTRYRYWGGIDPRGRVKPPLVGSAPTVDADPWTMHLYEPIDSWGGYWGTSAAEFAAALRSVPGDAALTIGINSPGGEVAEAVAMATLIRQRAGQTTMRVDGLAASAASYLAITGDRTVMGAEEAYLMIHDPLTITYGNEADHLAGAALLGSFGDTMAAAYARKAEGEAAGWRAIMREEKWYNAAEAVAAGLADAVLEAGAAADDAAPVAASFDLTVFKHPPIEARIAASLPPVIPPAGVAPVAPPPAADPPASAPFDRAAFRAGLLDALKGAS